MGLAELMEIRPGITAVIGGGGKTTLLRDIIRMLSNQIHAPWCKINPDIPVCSKNLLEFFN